MSNFKYLRSLIFLLVLLISRSYAQSSGTTVKFDGVDGKAVANLNTGNNNGSMTMEFWFARVSDQAGSVYLGDFHSISGTNRRRVIPYINNGEIGVYAAPHTGDDVNSISQLTGVVPALNIWTHIAVTISGANLKMYVNGKQYLNTSLTDNYSLTGTEVLSIATDYWGTAFANIRADEIRLWGSERTQAQIQANMYKELGGGEANLLAYYKLNNGAGTTFEDNQFLGNYDGTLSGGITWQPSGAFAETKNTLDFDGSDDYVNCGNGAQVQFNGTQSLTVEAWVKPTAAQWGSVVSKFQHHATHEGYSLEMFSDYRVAFLFGNNWSDWNAATTSSALTPNVWSHIAASYDGSTLRVYINGRLDVSLGWTNGITDSGTDLVIGARMGTIVFSTFFAGNIDEVRVWNAVRTEAQLKESMFKTLKGDEANLQAYYRFDENDGIIAYDNSNNGYNGTLTDMEIPSDWVTSDAFNTWIGAESASWTSSGNWAKGSPTSDQSIGLYKWNLGEEAKISSTPTVRNLLISSTSAPILNSGITVNGNLILENNFDLNGNNITLGSTSFLLEGNGVLSGTTGTISTTRNLNNISSNVALLGATITTTANLGSTTITRGHAVQSGNGNSSIQRYYDITPTNNSSLNATLVFNYRDSELNALTEANFKLYKSTNSGTDWSDQGGILNAGANTLTKSGIASFSRWTVGDGSLPLVSIPPSLAAIEGGGLSYSEGAGAVQITNTITVSDPDDVNIESATVRVTGNYQNGQDVLGFTNQNGITGTWTAATGTMALSGSATLANYQAALRSVTFNNTSENPNTSVRTVSFTVNDGDNNSNTVTRQINVTSINDAPVLAAIEGAAINYTEGDAATVITSTTTVADVDDTNIENAVVQITVNYQNGKDQLVFTNQNGITGSWNAATGAMTLTGSTTLANYQTALRDVKYQCVSASATSSVRTVSFTVNDGDNNSNTLTRQINYTAVNNAPVLNAIEASILDYTEMSGAQIITASIQVNDADDTNIESAIVQIIDNYNNGQDILSFTNQNGITGAWNAAAGTMTLTGSATKANYQAALQSITYTNTSSNPHTIKRTIGFTINDGDVNSNTVSRQINIITINDAPQLTAIEGAALNYTENNPPVNITTTLNVFDSDDNNLAGAVIQISNNYQSNQDVLGFTNQNGITGSWNTINGTLTLSGTSDAANYQAAIRSITYSNTSVDPSALARTISITVNDGKTNSNTLGRNINVIPVNGAPVLANVETAPLIFTEGDQAKNITGTITVADNDDVNMENATVQISGNYRNGQDILSFTNQNGITGTWNAFNGTMTLTGSSSKANYQTAIGSIKYFNSSSNPNTEQRTVSITVNDGNLNSNTVTRLINLTPSNNAPLLSAIETERLNYTEKETPKTVTNTITVTDDDNTTLGSAVVQITNNYTQGEDLLSFTNQNGITGSWNAASGTMTLSGNASLSNYQTALRNVLYSNTSQLPNTLTRRISFTVSDGTLSSNTVTREINITALNDAPVLSAIENTPLSFTEGSDPIQLTNAITISDPDNTEISGALIQITTNYNSSQDQIYFTNLGSISGSWNALQGTLTLSGSAPINDYIAALRSLKYKNNSSNPDVNQRTITFTVNDGGLPSNLQSRVLNIIPVNNPPLLSDASPAIIQYVESSTPVLISPAAVITDSDNTKLNGALVSIAANYKSGEDVLNFTPASGINGTWNASTGILTLTGNAEISIYQNALRSITYTNTSKNPSTSQRTIGITVNDGSLNSNTLSKTIQIKSIDDKPALQVNSELKVNEGEKGIITSALLSSTDVDSPAQDIIYQVTELPKNGQLFKGTAAISLQGTFTQADINGNLISYTHNGGETSSDKFIFTISNPNETPSLPSAFNIKVEPVNDPPAFLPIPDITMDMNKTYDIDVSKFVTDPDNTFSQLQFTFDAVTKKITITSLDGTTYRATPAPNWFGTETINILVSDGKLTATTTVIVKVLPVTGITSFGKEIPKTYAMESNYPNPFNPSTKIRFHIPEESFVLLCVYNILGEKITELINNVVSPGSYEVEWNTKSLASGIYIFRIDAKSNSSKNSFRLTKKMIFQK